MEILNLTPVLPAHDLAHEVVFWEQVLGVEPVFVDGERWAQFDVDGRRLALSGTDRVADAPAVMLKVSDVATTRSHLVSAGVDVGPVEQGPHERRCTVASPSGWAAVLYDNA